MDIDADIALAHRLADAAGNAIRPYWRGEIGLETKGDDTAVTLADRAAEGAMRRLLNAERPADGIEGEEFGSERADATRRWVLDPIDGTTSFVAGRPIFGTLIALLYEGFPVLGLIDQPILGERWIGSAGQPTLFNGQPARTRPCRELSDALLASTSPSMFRDHEAERFMALAGRCAHQRMIWGGDCYNYGLLAGGHVDLVCETRLKLHDFAALVPVVEGAGGTMADWNGDPLHAGSAGDVIALGDPARLEEVVEALACGH